jgi:hypothetical protein
MIWTKQLVLVDGKERLGEWPWALDLQRNQHGWVFSSALTWDARPDLFVVTASTGAGEALE